MNAQQTYVRFLVAVVVVAVVALSFMYVSTVGESDTFTVAHLQNKLYEREKQIMHLVSGRAAAGAARSPDQVASWSDSLSRVAVGENGKPLNTTWFHDSLSAENDGLVRELVFRRNTRYWLETQPKWPRDPLPATDKFVTFSPWRGGFNNIRMSLEMAVAFAAATGRTLVMPPEMNMYLRGKSSLTSYFDYEALRRGVPTVTYDEFFELVDFGRYQKERPSPRDVHSTVERYFEGLAAMPGVYNTKEHWSNDAIGGQIVYCVPQCSQDGASLRGGADAATATGAERAKQDKWFQAFARKLTKFNTNAPEIADAKVVHFPQNLLGHFYTMVYFLDPQEGRRVKRIVRDHVHFRAEIFEMAERIISVLGDFEFSCLHIRRNEFQFKDAWTPAEEIIENTRRLFKEGEKIYISTDELSDEKERKRKWSDPSAMVTVAKHTWFEPMKKAWGPDNVVFLSDFFEDLLGPNTPSIYLGCIESVVCSRARVFVGTRKSTFSGYIHRLRGYMHDVGQKLILDAQSRYPYDYLGYFEGPEWSKLKGAYGGGHPYWGREYRDAWEGVYDPLG